MLTHFLAQGVDYTTKRVMSVNTDICLYWHFVQQILNIAQNYFDITVAPLLNLICGK